MSTFSKMKIKNRTLAAFIAVLSLLAPFAQLAPAEAAARVVTAPGVNVGGDAYGLAFDDNDHVFSMDHFDANFEIRCFNTDATVCGTGWPFTAAATPQLDMRQAKSEMFYDQVNDHLWVNANTAGTSGKHGFLCVDVGVFTAPALCGGSIATAFAFAEPNGPKNDYGALATFTNAMNLTVIGDYLFMISYTTRHVICVEYKANSGLGAACPDTSSFVVAPTEKPAGSQMDTVEIWGNRADNMGMMAWGTRLYGYTTDKLFCADTANVATTSTWSKCAGWSTYYISNGTVDHDGSVTTGHRNNSASVYQEPNAQGVVSKLCFNPRDICFSADGTQSTENPALKAGIYDTNGWHGNPATVGSKVIWSDGWNHIMNGPKHNLLRCYDVATSSACANWTVSGNGVTANEVYGAVMDPNSPNCIWASGDNALTGSIFVFDLRQPTANSLSCTAAGAAVVSTGPTITTSPVTYSKNVGELFTIANTATSGTAPIATTGAVWSATGLPAGFTINPATGVISGSSTEAGDFDVDVTVTDTAGLTDTTTLTLTVVGPPKITTDPLKYVFPVGVDLAAGNDEIINSADEGSAEISGANAWTIIAGTLPAGLVMDPATGEISGTPTAVGVSTIQVKVTDDAGLFDTTTIVIGVYDPAKNLTILALPDAVVTGAVVTPTLYDLTDLGESTKNLPVTFKVTNTAVCYVDVANKLHLVSVGTCTVTASSGTGALLSTDTKSFVIGKAPQTVTIIQPGTTVNGITAPKATDSSNGFKLVAPMSSGLPGVFSSLTPKICLVEPDGQVTWMVDASKAGMNTCKVKVTQPGNAGYYALPDSPANTFDIVATHVASPAKPADQVSTEAPISTPRAPGTYKNGPWTITITNKKITVLGPVSSGTFIGPVIAVTTIPYVDAKGKKKVQTCTIKFGRETPFKKTDPAAWKNRLTAPTKPCELNAEAFAFYNKGNSVKLTTKVTRDRRWPTTNKNRVGDDGKGKLIPKIISNWKIAIG